MRRIFTILFITLQAIVIKAAPVDQEQARNVAQSFLKSNFLSLRSVQPELILVWSDAGATTRSGQEASYYVFTPAGQKGFIVVSGDDDVYPILGYSTEQAFQTESMPSNLRAWFDGYQRQISWIRANRPDVSTKVVSAWNSLRTNSLQLKAGGVQLTTVLWDQMTPYNDLCPTVNGEKTPTGCVATSTSIAMQFHKWPDVGQGSYTYTSSTYNLTLSATFDTPYAWDNMPDTYTAGSYTTEQAENVATLMYDVGVFSEMDYAPGNSGAQTLTAARGLVNYMKYDKSLQVLQRDAYQQEEWESLIKNELNENRPVVYGGENDKQEGHQFILDGYNENDYYHVNWGWSGLANGFYLLSALEPEVQGTGGNSGGGFNLNQDAMISFKKPEVNSTYQDVLYLFPDTTNGTALDGLATNVTSISQGVQFPVMAGFIGNFSLREFTGVMAVALVDQDGNLKQLVSSQDSISDLPVNEGTANEFLCEITTSIDPTDKLRLLYKSSDSGTWQWVRGTSNTVSEIAVDNPTSTEEVKAALNVTFVADASGNIRLSSVSDIQEVVLFDVNGRQLDLRKVNTPSATLSYSQYPAGVYILRVSTAEGTDSYKFKKN